MITHKQAETLPDGTRVRVTWNGGNGPHEYVIDVDRFGVRRISEVKLGQRFYVGRIDETTSIEAVDAGGPHG